MNGSLGKSSPTIFLGREIGLVGEHRTGDPPARELGEQLWNSGNGRVVAVHRVEYSRRICCTTSAIPLFDDVMRQRRRTRISMPSPTRYR